MVSKELEEAGLPTVLICAAPNMALSLGISRVVRGGGISHPTGNPTLSSKEEDVFQRCLVASALKALSHSPCDEE